MPEQRDPTTHVRIAFFTDGRLTSLPRREGYRMAALALLAERFARERDYAERDVNQLLAADAPDHATLRRLLVDHGFLERAAGVYRRVR